MQKKTDKVKEIVRFCEDCAIGEWDSKFINLDCNGKPFCIRCGFFENGKFVLPRNSAISRNTATKCEHFKPKSR